jgi:fatty-acid peroxygenase
MSDVIDHSDGFPTAIPRLAKWDSSVDLLADPYRFIGRNCAALDSDVFETRLQLQPTICMTGAQAAELFYDPLRFQRQGAAPEALRATLFGKGALQSLDGDSHRHRKALFMMLSSPARLADLEGQVRLAWMRALPAWSSRGRIELYRMMQPVLTRAVCDWAGVPLLESDVDVRSRQLTALFDGAASGLTAHLGSRAARWQAERWLAALVEESRDGRLALPAGSIAQAIASHRDVQGRLLPARIVAVELLNVLRPTVAVSVYITFVAHALHVQSGWRTRLLDVLDSQGSVDPVEPTAFVQEVRRHYPFFPAVVAKVREDFEWHGWRFPKGRRTLFDLFGTNHDARWWNDPLAFKPERWLQSRPDEFQFVPQGGGQAAIHHRCPGEDVAVRLMELALRMLLQRMRYDVPAQDLSILMNRLPAIPRDGFVIEGVRPA